MYVRLTVHPRAHFLLFWIFRMGHRGAVPRKVCGTGPTPEGDDHGHRHRQVVQRGKGFGFIEQDGGGADVFAHYSNIAAQGYRELREGQKVSFDVTQGQKGPQAENIVPA